MGNSKSMSVREELGEKIFQHAKVIFHDELDDSELERITGMILDSSQSLDDLQLLFETNSHEIERRIKVSASIIRKQSNAEANSMPESKSNKDADSVEKSDAKRQELISLFNRLYPSVDANVVADELLKLPDKELNYVISTPNELQNFIKSCSSKEKHSNISQTTSAATWKLEAMDLLNQIKLCPTKQSSETEISEDDVEGLIGDHLFRVVSELHPSFAARITGILMQLEKDVVLHLLASPSSLHKKIAIVINGLEKNNELSARDLVTLRDDLGDVIYGILEKEINADTASHVTGMLLEMSVSTIHEVLADENAFWDSVKIAINALGKG